MLRILLAAVALTACSWDSAAPLERPQPGYPCGTAGTVCTDARNRATGMCCDQGEVCGGAPGAHCVDGMCCDIASADGPTEARRRPHKQRPAR